MKGFYLNCDKNEAIKFINKMDCHYRIDEFPSETELSCFIINDPFEWKEEPFYFNKETNIFSACYGWFIYKNKKNALKDFSLDFAEKGEEILHDISAGLFIILIKNNSKIYFINDPFGLSNHYFRKESNFIEIAPSPFFLHGEKKVSEIQKSIIAKYAHSFGNATLFTDIKRINPGTILSDGVFKTYYQPKIRTFKPENIVEEINKFVNYWDYDSRVLALSGGLDSRLVLASSKIKYGYTYGPANSSDRPVAEKFRNKFAQYYGFSIAEMDFYKKDIQIVNDIFSGLCPSPIASLLTIYRYLRNYFGDKAYVSFDAFLGGVLQRGSFLNVSSGFWGCILKLFPSLTVKIKAEKILGERYKLLNNSEKELLIKDFEEKTANMNMDEHHKVLYYEFAYGRGARFTSNGGIVMNSQFYTVAPPFTYIPLFENIFSADIAKTLSFETVHKIWKEVDSVYSTVPTQLWFSPNSSSIKIKYKKLLKQILIKSFLKNTYDYASEIKEIKWKN